MSVALSPEFYGRERINDSSLSIYHYPYCDVVVNHVADTEDVRLMDLADELAALPPSSWPPAAFNRGHNLAVWRFNGVPLAFKRKMVLTPAEIVTFRRPRSQTPILHFDSVIKEMCLTEQIVDILHDPETRDFVSEFGYEGIEFVPALLAVIERTGLKMTVHNYIDSYSLSAIDPAARRLSTGLIDRFYRGGIVAHDLHPGHLLARDGHLHLIDAEGFIAPKIS